MNGGAVGDARKRHDDAAEVERLRAAMLALAVEMENPYTERGTMPGVRMHVRRRWAARIRAAVLS